MQNIVHQKVSFFPYPGHWVNFLRATLIITYSSRNRQIEPMQTCSSTYVYVIFVYTRQMFFCTLLLLFFKLVSLYTYIKKIANYYTVSIFIPYLIWPPIHVHVYYFQMFTSTFQKISYALYKKHDLRKFI